MNRLRDRNIFVSVFILITLFGCNSNNSKINEGDNYIPLKIPLTKIKSQDELNGLWKCVKAIKDTSLEKIDISSEPDIYINKNLLFDFVYPCSRYYWQKDISFRNDSLLCYNPYNDYTDKYIVGKIQDTLVLREFTESFYGAETYYYLAQDYESNLINEIIANGYNSECLQGDWKLEFIMDNKAHTLDKSQINYTILDELSFKLEKAKNYQIQNDTLSYQLNTDTLLYKINDFHWSNKTKEISMLLVYLNHQNGSDYELMYERIER